MVTHSPVHHRHDVRVPSKPDSGERSAGMVAALVVPAIIIAWAVLVVGLYAFSHSVAGMSVLYARAFAIGFVSYVFLFIGFIYGLIKLITREGSSV